MKSRRRTHQLPRIDLTPFVSVALLLITFFIWIKQLQQPVILPGYTGTNSKSDYYERLRATLFLLDHNRIGLLHYRPAGDSADYLETDYSVNGLCAQLANMTRTDPLKRIAVLIVPTPQATVKNIVDAIDELITHRRIDYVLTYSPTAGDYQMMAKYQNYKNTTLHQSAFITLPPNRWHLYPGFSPVYQR